MLPVSYTRDPRIRLLDITAALTLSQQHQLAEAASADRTPHAEARDRVVGHLSTHDAHADAGWIADRWGRWTQVFAVPAPISTLGWAHDRAASAVVRLLGPPRHHGETIWRAIRSAFARLRATASS